MQDDIKPVPSPQPAPELTLADNPTAPEPPVENTNTEVKPSAQPPAAPKNQPEHTQHIGPILLALIILIALAAVAIIAGMQDSSGSNL